MSIFNNILFLPDPPIRALDAHPVQSTYAHGYGNRMASAKAFAPLGHPRHAPDGRSAQARRSAASANDHCRLRACS